MVTGGVVKASFLLDGIRHEIQVDERKAHFEITRSDPTSSTRIAEAQGEWNVEGRHPNADPDTLLFAASDAIKPKLKKY